MITYLGLSCRAGLLMLLLHAINATAQPFILLAVQGSFSMAGFQPSPQALHCSQATSCWNKAEVCVRLSVLDVYVTVQPLHGFASSPHCDLTPAVKQCVITQSQHSCQGSRLGCQSRSNTEAALLDSQPVLLTIAAVKKPYNQAKANLVYTASCGSLLLNFYANDLGQEYCPE